VIGRYAIITILSLIALTFPAAAQTVYRGRNGRTVATESTVGGVRVYRGPDGRVIGTETQMGGTRVFNGPDGRALGTATPFTGGR
jgi:hypothetical protein